MKWILCVAIYVALMCGLVSAFSSPISQHASSTGGFVDVSVDGNAFDGISNELPYIATARNLLAYSGPSVSRMLGNVTLTPSFGAGSSQNTVTITSMLADVKLGSGCDITLVSVAGLLCSIVGQSSQAVTVTTNRISSAVMTRSPVLIYSASLGVSAVPSSYLAVPQFTFTPSYKFASASVTVTLSCAVLLNTNSIVGVLVGSVFSPVQSASSSPSGTTIVLAVGAVPIGSSTAVSIVHQSLGVFALSQTFSVLADSSIVGISPATAPSQCQQKLTVTGSFTGTVNRVTIASVDVRSFQQISSTQLLVLTQTVSTVGAVSVSVYFTEQATPALTANNMLTILDNTPCLSIPAPTVAYAFVDTARTITISANSFYAAVPCLDHSSATLNGIVATNVVATSGEYRITTAITSDTAAPGFGSLVLSGGSCATDTLTANTAFGVLYSVRTTVTPYSLRGVTAVTISGQRFTNYEASYSANVFWDGTRVSSSSYDSSKNLLVLAVPSGLSGAGQLTSVISFSNDASKAFVIQYQLGTVVTETMQTSPQYVRTNDLVTLQYALTANMYLLGRISSAYMLRVNDTAVSQRVTAEVVTQTGSTVQLRVPQQLVDGEYQIRCYSESWGVLQAQNVYIHQYTFTPATLPRFTAFTLTIDSALPMTDKLTDSVFIRIASASSSALTATIVTSFRVIAQIPALTSTSDTVFVYLDLVSATHLQSVVAVPLVSMYSSLLVLPTMFAATGSQTFTLYGSALGSGTDFRSMTFSDKISGGNSSFTIALADISVQTKTSIVFTTPGAINSTSYGLISIRTTSYGIKYGLLQSAFAPDAYNMLVVPAYDKITPLPALTVTLKQLIPGDATSALMTVCGVVQPSIAQRGVAQFVVQLTGPFNISAESFANACPVKVEITASGGTVTTIVGPDFYLMAPTATAAKWFVRSLPYKSHLIGNVITGLAETVYFRVDNVIGMHNFDITVFQVCVWGTGTCYLANVQSYPDRNSVIAKLPHLVELHPNARFNVAAFSNLYGPISCGGCYSIAAQGSSIAVALGPAISYAYSGLKITITLPAFNADDTIMFFGEEAVATTPNIDATNKFSVYVPDNSLAGDNLPLAVYVNGAVVATTVSFAGIGSVNPSSVLNNGGAVITLRGSGLDQVTSVQIGSTIIPAIQFASITLSNVILVSPSLSQTGAVTVGFNGPGNYTYSDKLTYVAAPIVYPSAWATSGGITCIISGYAFIDTTDPSDTITGVTIGGTSATILSQTPTSVTVTLPGGSIGFAHVVVTTTLTTLTVYNGFRYAASAIQSVVPAQMSTNGQGSVTVSGFQLGSGSDIVSVFFDNVTVSAIVSQTANSVTVTAPLTSTGVKVVRVLSTSKGASMQAGAITFVAGSISTVSPNNGPLAGATVTITGQLGAGSDITQVQFGGVTANIMAQSSTTVTVVVASSGSSGAKDVVVRSATYGTSTLLSGYTINSGGIFVSVTPSRAHLEAAQLITLIGSGLASCLTSDVTSVTIGDFSTVIVSQSATSIVVQFTVPIARIGARDVVVQSSSIGTSTLAGGFEFFADKPYLLSVTPVAVSVSGGTTVTIAGTYLTNTSDVASVLFGTVPCTDIIRVNSDEVVVVSGASLKADTFNVTVVSRAFGNVVLGNAISYFASVIGTVPQATATEDGTSATIQFSLNTPPEVNATVALSVICINPILLSVTSLTFDANNYATPQQVAVSAVDDSTAFRNAVCNITAVVSSPSVYLHGISTRVSVNIVDNDVAGFTQGQGSFAASALLSSGGYLLNEGASASLSLRLSSQPLHTVTVTLVSLSPSAVTLGTSTLTFTVSSWNTPQNVLVNSVSDNVFTDALTWRYVAISCASADDIYSPLVSQISLLIVDNSAPATVRVSLSQAVANVTEAGQTATVYVVLLQHINANVTVTSTVSLPSRASVTPGVVSLSDGMYLSPQPLTLSAIDNRYADGDVQVRLTTTASDSEIQRLLWCLDNDVAGASISRRFLTVNETGTLDTTTLTLNSSPFPDQPIVVTVLSLDTTEVAVSTASIFLITNVNWQQGFNVTMSGVRDEIIDGNTNTSVLVTLLTNDTAYNLVQFTVTVTCLNVNFPTVSTFAPSVFPSGNGSVVVSVLGTMSSDITLWVGQQLVQNYTVSNVTAGRRRVLLQSAEKRLSFVVPSVNVSGYQAVTIQNNDDGGLIVYSPGFYYSASCPYPGQYGSGASCTSCPANADCPGGNRLWPHAGYWSSTEHSQNIFMCPVPARCMGGRLSSCVSGYSGFVCSQCLPGEYMSSAGVCQQCLATDQQGALVFAQALFLAIVVVVLIAASDDIWDKMDFLLQMFRTLWIVTFRRGAGIVVPIQQTFEGLSIFAGDFEIVHPECMANPNYSSFFAMNVSTLFLLAVPILLGIYIRYKIMLNQKLAAMTKKRHGYGRRSAKGLAVLYDKHYLLLINRIARAIVGYMSFAYGFYAMVSTASWLCIDPGLNSLTGVQGAVFLARDPTVACFIGGHNAVMVISVLIFTLLTVAYPILTLALCKLTPLHPGEWVQPTLSQSIVQHYVSQVHEGAWWYPAVKMLALDAVLVMVSTLTISVDVTNYISMSLLAVALIGSIVLRPYTMWYKNIGVVLICASSLFIVVAQQLASKSLATASLALAILAEITFLVFLAGIVLVIIYTTMKRMHPVPLRRFSRIDSQLRRYVNHRAVRNTVYAAHLAEDPYITVESRLGMAANDYDVGYVPHPDATLSPQELTAKLQLSPSSMALVSTPSMQHLYNLRPGSVIVEFPDRPGQADTGAGGGTIVIEGLDLSHQDHIATVHPRSSPRGSPAATRALTPRSNALNIAALISPLTLDEGDLSLSAHAAEPVMLNTSLSPMVIEPAIPQPGRQQSSALLSIASSQALASIASQSQLGKKPEPEAVAPEELRPRVLHFDNASTMVEADTVSEPSIEGVSVDSDSTDTDSDTEATAAEGVTEDGVTPRTRERLAAQVVTAQLRAVASAKQVQKASPRQGIKWDTYQ